MSIVIKLQTKLKFMLFHYVIKYKINSYNILILYDRSDSISLLSSSDEHSMFLKGCAISIAYPRKVNTYYSER